MADGVDILWAAKDLFLCLGSNLGKNFNPGSAPEKGDPLANRCYLYLKQEEILDHLLIGCIKTRPL